MATVILVIHLLLALSIIALVLLQRSEGGGLGIGGGGGGMGSFATAGQTANVLSRATAVCAGLFFTTSLILAILAGTNTRAPSMLDALDTPAPVTAPAGADVKPGDKGTSMPTNAHSNIDKTDAKDDKEVPKAADKPQPQTGAPSAPISE